MTAEEEVALSSEAPIEIDEEGQISQGEDDNDAVDVAIDDENKSGEDKDLLLDDGGGGAPDGDVVNSPLSYDDDEPPPPPPPLPDGAETEKSADNNGRKKKMALFVAAIGVCVGLGVGLGVSLQGDNKNAQESNVQDPGNVESPPATTTAATTTSISEVDPEPIEVDSVSSTTTTATTNSYEIDEPSSTTTEATPDAVVTTITASAEETTVAATTVTATEAGVVEPPTLYDAVIIGAGWSGIRATETLLDAGITNILVLEANDYIGGRAITINEDGSKNNPDKIDDFTNIPRDLGCAWLYATGNSMEDEIIDRGYMTGGVLENTKESTNPLDGIFYLQTRNDDGSLTAELMEDGKELLDEIWGGFWQFRDNRLDEMGGFSYAEAIDEYIDRWNWNDDTSLQFLNMIEEVAEAEYTGDSTQLDLNEIEFFPPGYSMETHYVGVPGKGYGNIAAKYAESFADKITLNAKVVEINSEENRDQPTITYVENGVTKAVKANAVLVTASLGALKAGIINFAPSLPAWKQEVIDKMGFGVVNKCIMYWNNDEDYVWPRDQMWYMLTTPDDETSGQWTTFFNPSEFKGVPALTAWIGGDEAIEAEKQTDDEILETVMKNLKSMFPTIRDPDKVLITRWGQEETIRGTYSFPAVGRDFYDDADLLQRRLGSVYFSGEATGSGWGTTMGAWKTGQAQAEAIAEKLAEAEAV